MAKVIILNGSPRKGWNTDLLLREAQKGTESTGAETEYINLYELNYKGCRSCLSCKVKGGKNNGHCLVDDDLKSVLQKIEEADAVIIGSPIYWGDITAETRAFFERFMFQVLNYEGTPFITKRTKVACIFTMNAPKETYDELYTRYERLFGMFYQYEGTVIASETLQTNDYSRFYVGNAEVEAYKKQRRETVFPETMKEAYNLGMRICQ